jgi:arsenical pump membrane protein
VLILLLIAYFVTARWQIPVSVVTGTAALIMLALAGRWTLICSNRVLSKST